MRREGMKVNARPERVGVIDASAYVPERLIREIERRGFNLMDLIILHAEAALMASPCSHGELHREVIKHTEESGDDEIRLLWQSAISLHQNFYENWLPPEMVEKNIEKVCRQA
jgi:hypothetical protein